MKLDDTPRSDNVDDERGAGGGSGGGYGLHLGIGGTLLVLVVGYFMGVNPQTLLGIISGALPRRALAFVLEWAREHRSELMENWNLCAQKQPPNRIAPLA